MTSRVVRVVAIAAFTLAVAYFVWRGVVPAIATSGDMTYGFAAAQAWIAGWNPYDARVLEAIMIADGGPVIPTAIGHGVYFPTSLPFFLPVAWATWDVAKLLWLAIDLAAAVFIAVGLVRWSGWSLTSTRAILMMAYILALGPIHATIAAGQTGVVATALIVGAMLFERSGRGTGAGLAYGLATAAKVQLGLPFVAYVAWRRRWLVVATALIVIGGLTVVAVLRMRLAAVPWLDSWLSNLAWLTGPLGNGDPGPENPDRFSLINLAYPLRSFLPEQLTSAVTIGFVAAAAVLLLWLAPRRPPRDDLLAMSVVAVLSLLVTYHRYYDGAILALPVAWGFSVLGTPRWRPGLVVLLLGFAFVVPMLGALLIAAGSLPAWLTGSALWNTAILPHHAWALVGMVIAMLWVAARDRFATASLPPTIAESSVPASADRSAPVAETVGR